MSICAGKKYFLSFIVTTLTAFQVTGQQQVVTSDPLAYRSAVVNATFKRINKEHYGPKPVDDAYSAAVWNQTFQTLDPNSNLFLQEDINKLAVYKNRIDDEMNAGSTDFFEATYAIYNKRAKEAEAICMKVLQQPFDLQKKESVMAWRKDQPFPASEAAREDLWRKLLKYYTLRHYVEMEKADTTVKEKKSVNTALEAKARGKVRNWYAEYFRKATGKDAVNEKFAQYMEVAVAEIDPHTAYTAPEDRAFNDMLTKRYCGIGVELAAKESDYYIKRMMRGGSAYKSGQVKENDIIVSIADAKGDMKPVSGWESNQVTSMIRGDKGSSVTMKLQQPGEAARTVTLKREELVDMENRAKSALIEKNGRMFGYVYLPLFYMDPNGQFLTGAAMDVYREVTKLKEYEVDGIVMDLRGNGGGALDEVVRMSGCFMPPGPVTMLKSKDSVKSYWSPAVPPVYEGPLTVLVDESSASASEIFAAAIQDRGRALIVGASSTFGKGTAQTVTNMGRMGDPDKGIPAISYGSMRLTKEKFYRITGVSTQLRGVTPDIILQDRMSLESVMEKDYPSALAYDSIATTACDRMPFAFNYDLVVKEAYDRIHNNASLKDIAANMQQLKELREKPVPLNIDAFRKSYLATTQLERMMQQSRELKEGHHLHMLPSIPRSANPATLKADPVEAAHTAEWLQKMSKDIYLNETVSVLEDILANQK